MSDTPSNFSHETEAATPQPDKNPQQRAKLKEAAESPANARGIRDGEDSLQAQAQRESQERPSAQDKLKDENGRKTPVQAGVAPNGDEQEAKRGKGQTTVS